MKTKDIILVVVLTASVCLNLWLCHDRLKTLYYQRGFKTAGQAVTNQVIRSVETKGKLDVVLSNGRMATLVRQKEEEIDK